MIEVRFDLNCGALTCASESNKFCKFFGTKTFGQVPVCRLFPSEEKSYTELRQLNGWSIRCDACLDAEKDVEDFKLCNVLSCGVR